MSSLELTSAVLTLGVIFVNGLTDAPNSIATCITTGCMPLRKAVMMSAALNFLGVVVMSNVNFSVAQTLTSMVSFGDDVHSASIALCSALFSITLWAVIAWYFGIPTSESHALIAGLSGSAVALGGGIGAIEIGEWIKTVYGLFTSCVGGFLLGFFICKTVFVIFKNTNRQRADVFFKKAQIFAAASMSFMHGAQDGQKFVAVLMMCGASTSVMPSASALTITVCSLVMALGTLTGGKKIIKSIGMDMVKLEKYQGFSADLAASVSLFLSTVFGFPVSTTHAKTTAMMGTGAAKKGSSLNRTVIKDILLTWVLTFPGCSILGFSATKIFLKIFN